MSGEGEKLSINNFGIITLYYPIKFDVKEISNSLQLFIQPQYQLAHK